MNYISKLKGKQLDKFNSVCSFVYIISYIISLVMASVMVVVATGQQSSIVVFAMTVWVAVTIGFAVASEVAGFAVAAVLVMVIGVVGFVAQGSCKAYYSYGDHWSTWNSIHSVADILCDYKWCCE
jgi:hypothetical protein